MTVSFNVIAQTGKDFWFAIPYIDHGHDRNSSDGIETGPNYFRISTGEAGAYVKFYHYPNGGENNETLLHTLYVSANSVETVTLADDGTEDFSLSDFTHSIYSSVLDKGLRISASNPVTVYYEIGSYNNTDIFALKGLDALGQEFYPVYQNIFPNRSNGGTTDSWQSIEFVATEDGTTVEIHTPATTSGGGALTVQSFSTYTTTTVSLDMGESYSIKSAVQTATKPLDGIYITSDKDIAVTIKDDSSFDGGAADVIGDQIIPTDNFGTMYLVPDFNTDQANMKQGIYVRAIEDGTEINIEGETNPIATLNSGEVYAYNNFSRNDSYKFIYTNDKPIICMQTAGFADGTATELAGAILPPVDECTGSTQASFNIPQNRGHEIAIISRTNTLSSFKHKEEGAVGWTDFFPTFTPIDVDNDGTEDWYFSLQPNITPTIGSNYIIKNTEATFHLGVLSDVADGGREGAFYGYFSDFTTPQLQIGFDTLSDGRVQLFAFGGVEGSYDWSMAVPTPVSTACVDNFFEPKPDCGTDNPIVLSSDILATTGQYTYSASGQNTCAATTLSNTVDFEVISNSAFLPINLAYLDATEISPNKVLIEWATHSEHNNDYFTLERSNDGYHFSEIATIKGAGNSNTEKSYEYYDNVDKQGNYFYRLTQYDYNSLSTTFPIISIKTDSENGGIAVFPTFIENNKPITLKIAEQTGEPLEISCYSTDSRCVYSQTVYATEPSVQLPLDLLPGVYKLYIKTDTQTYHYQIIKK